ncbi:MAG: META domain-containing protein [Anaerolineales bacterium]
MKRFLSLFILVFITGLAGCSAMHPGESLNGSSWTCIQLNGHSLLPGTHISISFSQNRFSGTAGCNQYGGSYKTSGIRFSTEASIEMTAMACLTPEGIMAQEQEYTSALTSAATFTLDGNQLEMQNADGESVLVFALKGAAKDVDPASLTGSEWRVRTVNNDNLIPHSEIIMRFLDPGMVNGFGGCRGYEAEYAQTDGGIRFIAIAMNEEVCNDEALLLQEQDFTDYLSNAKHLEMVDGLLVLSTQQGVEVVVERVGD